MSQKLPPCGVYLTRAPIGDVPAGRFVYFHNHGDPGPGLYLPEGWSLNRARFSPRGYTIPDPVAPHVAQLEPLPAEGFYRVRNAFECCEKRCRTFEENLLVQVGYNGAAEAIVFVPELTATGFAIPANGTPVSRVRLSNLEPLKVAEQQTAPETARGMLH